MMGHVLVWGIRMYQRYISRWTPTCSEYAAQAILRHGPLRGLGMAAKRLCRCQPFHPGGYDPVK